MQMHIQVDDVLNDVHLYLPYFNEDTVKDVVEALQSTEGGDIPTDIYGESLSGKRFETLTVKPKKKKEDQPTPGQMTLFDVFLDRPLIHRPQVLQLRQVGRTVLLLRLRRLLNRQVRRNRPVRAISRELNPLHLRRVHLSHHKHR